MNVENYPPLVIAWGGGTNSTAMIVGYAERGIHPDLILFADTGGEKPNTYKYIDVLREWLASRGFPDLVIVRKEGRNLEDECLDNDMLPSLAYGFKSCSDKWKIRPQDKYCNHWEPAQKCWSDGLKVRKAIGYDAGPRDRKRARIAENSKYLFEYPLIEWGWDRAACEETILRAGLPLPGKSACFFCPASKKHEVVRLSREHPDLFARAVEMEENAQGNLQTVKGLGRHWRWSELVQLDESRLRETVEAPQIACTCFDGTD